MTVLDKLAQGFRPQTKATAVNRAPSTLAKPITLFSDNRDAETLAQFSSVSTLWKGLTVRAESFASVEWRLYRVNGRSKNRTLVESHPALVMLEKPNDFQDGYDFRVTYSLMMDLLGKAFIYTPSDGPFPRHQYLLRPDRVKVIPNDAGTEIVAFEYKEPSGKTIPYSPNEVSLRRLPDPCNPLDGIGAVETLLAELAITRLSRQWQANFFANNASPGGVYSFKEPLEPAEFDELTERIRSRHYGLGNANKDIILDNDATYNRVEFSMKEMMFPELREQSRDTVLEGIGLPKTFLGQATEVNRASAETLEMIYARYEQVPALTRYKSWLNNDVLPRFGSKNNYVFDYVNPVKEDIDRQVKAVNAVVQLVKLGADPHEAMELFGIGDLDFNNGSTATAPASDYNQSQGASESIEDSLDANI